MKRSRIVLAIVALLAALSVTGVAFASVVLLGSNATSFTNTQTSVPGSQNLIAYKYAATATASTLTANFYFGTHGAANEVVGVYSDDAVNGRPGSLLGSVTMPTGLGWKVATFTGVNLTSGTNYWIAELQTNNPSGEQVSYPVDGSKQDFDGACNGPDTPPVVYTVVGTVSSMPSSFPSSGYSTGSYCEHGLVIKG